MCGITGAVWTSVDRAVDPRTLDRMTDSLTHRGPDDRAVFFQALGQESPSAGSGAHAQNFVGSAHHANVGVGLGFRRLSIIDLATGMQPISNEDGTIQVVFNGEIYNYRELRKRLEGSGHRLRTQGDAETIVHLYEDEGADCFKLLRGMFAIAIWDGRLKKLLLARDRLGQKPLFYAKQSQRLVFGSELKALLPVSGLDTQINLSAIDSYLLYQYVPHPDTIYRGIASLPPGHLAVWQAGREQGESFELRAYWNCPTTEKRQDKSAAIAQLQTTLEQAVVMRMQSEVPLGTFLSGGVDSSLIAALMQKNSAEPIRTFSIGFRESEYDESKYSQQVARHLGTQHEAFIVQPEAITVLPDLIYHYDQPFADSSAIPTWYLSQMTKRQVTVALSGDGSDELFSGYNRYQAARFAGFLDQIPGMQSFLAWPIWQRIPSDMSQRNMLRRWKRFSQAMRLPPVARYMQWIGIFHDHQRAALYSERFLEQLPQRDPLEFVERYERLFAKRDTVTRFALTDLLSYLPCDLNTKVDIASMAHGLEVRQPFLDHHVVELAAQMPNAWKLRWNRGKRILQDAFGDLLPAEIWARKKIGFGVPLDHWFRGPMRELTEQTLLGTAAARRGLFEPAEVSRMVHEHVSGKFDNAYRLWSLLVLELWFQRWQPDFAV
jgi:asparagine synthase (glutamine-hydrolysing)